MIKVHDDRIISILRNVRLSSVEPVQQGACQVLSSPDGALLRIENAPAGQSLTVELYDLSGRRLARLFDGIATDKAMHLPLPPLAPGLYAIRLRCADSWFVRPLLVEQAR